LANHEDPIPSTREKARYNHAESRPAHSAVKRAGAETKSRQPREINPIRLEKSLREIVFRSCRNREFEMENQVHIPRQTNNPSTPESRAERSPRISGMGLMQSKSALTEKQPLPASFQG